MSANDWVFDDDDDEDMVSESGGEASAMKQVRKALRDAKKRLAELEAENQTLNGQVRSTAIKESLKAKGVNPKIAAFVPQDIEPSEEAVAKWLDDYADVFGIQVAEPEPTAVPQDQVENLRQIINARDSARTASTDADWESKIKSAESPEQLTEILKSLTAG